MAVKTWKPKKIDYARLRSKIVELREAVREVYNSELAGTERAPGDLISFDLINIISELSGITDYIDKANGASAMNRRLSEKSFDLRGDSAILSA